MGGVRGGVRFALGGSSDDELRALRVCGHTHQLRGQVNTDHFGWRITWGGRGGGGGGRVVGDWE